MRTSEITLINCHVNLTLNWYKECVVSSSALAAEA